MTENASDLQRQTLQAVRRELVSLPNSGPRGFEGLVASCLSEQIGRPVALCSSGRQFGADLGTFDDESVIVVEAKKYDRSGLNERELLGGIAQLARKEGTDHPTWILATTAMASRQVAESLAFELQDRSMSFGLLDWNTNSKVPLLFAFLVKNKASILSWASRHDHLRSLTTLLDQDPTHWEQIDPVPFGYLGVLISQISWDPAPVRAALRDAKKQLESSVRHSALTLAENALFCVDSIEKVRTNRVPKTIHKLRLSLSVAAQYLALSGGKMKKELEVDFACSLHDNASAILADDGDLLNRIDQGGEVLIQLSKIVDAFDYEFGISAENKGASIETHFDMNSARNTKIGKQLSQMSRLTEALCRIYLMQDRITEDRELVDKILEIQLVISRRYVEVNRIANLIVELRELFEHRSSTHSRAILKLIEGCKLLLGQYVEQDVLPCRSIFSWEQLEQDFVVIRGEIPGTKIAQKFAISRSGTPLEQLPAFEGRDFSVWQPNSSEIATAVVSFIEECSSSIGIQLSIPSRDHIQIAAAAEMREVVEFSHDSAEITSDTEIEFSHQTRVFLYCTPWIKPNTEPRTYA